MDEDKEATILDNYERNLSQELRHKLKTKQLTANNLADQVAQLQCKLYEIVHLMNDGQKIYTNYFFYDGLIDTSSFAFKEMNREIMDD